MTNGRQRVLASGFVELSPSAKSGYTGTWEGSLEESEARSAPLTPSGPSALWRRVPEMCTAEEEEEEEEEAPGSFGEGAARRDLCWRRDAGTRREPGHPVVEPGCSSSSSAGLWGMQRAPGAAVGGGDGFEQGPRAPEERLRVRFASQHIWAVLCGALRHRSRSQWPCKRQREELLWAP